MKTVPFHPGDRVQFNVSRPTVHVRPFYTVRNCFADTHADIYWVTLEDYDELVRADELAPKRLVEDRVRLALVLPGEFYRVIGTDYLCMRLSTSCRDPLTDRLLTGVVVGSWSTRDVCCIGELTTHPLTDKVIRFNRSDIVVFLSDTHRELTRA